jgi:hypothetical protein
MATAHSTPRSRHSLSRPLHGPSLAFDLSAEAAAMRGELEWREHGRTARTLAKYPDTRLVLEVMRKGTRFTPNGPSERIAVHCLAGRVRVHLPDGHVVEVGGGALCALDRYMTIEVEALEDSTCLLTVSWPALA